MSPCFMQWTEFFSHRIYKYVLLVHQYTNRYCIFMLHSTNATTWTNWHIQIVCDTDALHIFCFIAHLIAEIKLKWEQNTLISTAFFSGSKSGRLLLSLSMITCDVHCRFCTEESQLPWKPQKFWMGNSWRVKLNFSSAMQINPGYPT